MDTHTLVWFAWDLPELPPRVKTLLEDSETAPQVSIASFWEIGIKVGLGERGPAGRRSGVAGARRSPGDRDRPLTVPAIHLLTRLEHHHKDPFDRLLAATALTSGNVLLSRDTIFDLYGVARFWD